MPKRKIRYISLFSGIEAASIAAQNLDWECVGFAEIEKFPAAVLAHNWPTIPNLGDVMADDFIDRVIALRPNLIVGGPPCQDYSVAGLRAGVTGERGYLTLRYAEIVDAVRLALGEEFIGSLTENVPGWLSANKGLAFGAYIAAVVGADSPLVPPRKCGGRWTGSGMAAGPKGRIAWRLFDAQFFGLAQRRERVFVVFCPHGGADPSEILFERKGMRGNPAPSREKGEGFAADVESGAGVGSHWDGEGNPHPTLGHGGQGGGSRL